MILQFFTFRVCRLCSQLCPTSTMSALKRFNKMACTSRVDVFVFFKSSSTTPENLPRKTQNAYKSRILPQWISSLVRTHYSPNMIKIAEQRSYVYDCQLCLYQVLLVTGKIYNLEHGERHYCKFIECLYRVQLGNVIYNQIFGLRGNYHRALGFIL